MNQEAARWNPAHLKNTMRVNATSIHQINKFKRSNGPVLTLERAVGERFDLDSRLWASGAFNALVFPYLPIATSWLNLVKGLLEGASPEPPSPVSSARSKAGFTVQTVAAQVRSLAQIKDLMRFACRVGNYGSPADALLLVSGSHPARGLPLKAFGYPDSVVMLQEASLMRQLGELPSTVSLWAVENPRLPPERLHRKLSAGAEVILTQPPLVRKQSENWFETAARLCEGTNAQILVGIPMASSRRNLEFWMQLCGLAGALDTQQVLASFPVKGTQSQGEYKDAVYEWNATFIEWVSCSGFIQWTYSYAV